MNGRINEGTAQSSRAVVARRLRWLGSAMMLCNLWRMRWYHALAIWILLALQGWSGAPYFLVHLGYVPQPGTAPRYIGTIRVEGELQHGRSGLKPSKYFIRTPTGEREFHCGFLPAPWECWFNGNLGEAPNPADVYEIGFHWYWGVDYIKHPPRLAFRDDRSSADIVHERRLAHARRHAGPAYAFAAALAIYLLLVRLAYAGGAADVHPSPSTAPAATERSRSQSDFK